MAPPKDIARSYPKRGLTADLGFKNEATFCSDGAIEFVGYGSGGGPFINYSLNKTFSAFTVASWVLIDGKSLYNYFMAAGGSGSFGGMVHLGWINGTTNPQLRLQDGKRAIAYIPSQTFPEVKGQWCHVACTINSAGDSVKMYVNGVEATGLTQPTSGNEIEMPGSDGSSVAHFNVGSFQFSAGPQVNGIGGKMANFGLYDAELTRDQIVRLMRGNDFATCSAVATPAVFFELFENNTESTGNVGTILNTGTPYFGYAYAQLPRGLDLTGGFKSPSLTFNGQCAAFNGTDQGAHVSNTYDCAASGAKTTIAAWFNSRDLTAISGNETIATIAVSNTASRFGVYTTATGEVASSANVAGTTPKVSTGNILNENRWYFVAATLDADSAQLKIYLDGVEFSVSPTLGLGGTDNTFEVGFRENSGSGLQQFDGRLANVMVIEDVLTQSEIVELMRDTTYAKAQTFGTVNRFYTLASNLNDSTGSHNLTGVNSPTFTTMPANPTRFIDPQRGAAQAKVETGRAVEFDGSTDFLDMGFGANKNYTTRSDRASFSVWFNTDTTAAVGFLYQNRKQVGSTDRPECETHLFLSPATGLGFDGEGASVLIPVGNIKVGVWHHFVGVADDSDGPVKAYLDGVLYDTISGVQAGANGDNFVIGARNNGPIQVFNGRLSNFKIFNVELTQAQVRELYHNPEMVIPTGVSASNLRRHYPLCAYNDTGGMGGRYEIDQGAEGVNGEYGGSPVMSFAEPVPCPQLGLQQSASRIYWDDNTAEKLSVTIPAFDSDFTIAFWWFRSSTSDADVWLEVQTPGTSQLYYDGTQIIYYSSTAGTFNTGVSCTEGEWSHIGITSAGVYKNGVLSTTSFTLDWPNTNYRIFGRHSTGLACNGICSNMGFWSDDLSTAEMLELYNQGPDYDPRNDTGNYASSATLTNLWFMDDLTTIKDRKGSNDLTVIGDPILASMPENASGSTIVGNFSMKRKGVSILNLTGADDGAAIIPGQEAVYPKAGAANGYTVGFCYRKTKDGTAMIWGNDGTSTNNQFMCFQQTGPAIRFNLGDGSSRPAITTSNLTDSDWHHYTLTISYATTPAEVKIYVDGVVDHSSTQSITGPPTDIRDMRLGEGLFDSQSPVGCFKFYHVALSADEVKQLAFSELRLIKGLQNE